MANTSSHEFGAPVNLTAKLVCDHRADGHLDEIERMRRRWPASPAKRDMWRPDPLHTLRRIAHEHLTCDIEGLNRLR